VLLHSQKPKGRPAGRPSRNQSCSRQRERAFVRRAVLFAFAGFFAVAVLRLAVVAINTS
jgi:hypothetical protein